MAFTLSAESLLQNGFCESRNLSLFGLSRPCYVKRANVVRLNKPQQLLVWKRWPTVPRNVEDWFAVLVGKGNSLL